MIDFGNLPRPAKNTKKIDPLEIFSATPSLEDAPNDLWKGQATALTEWHSNRNKNDILIQLNTGAGKSIVGALIAQSLLNEDIGSIVYCCSTIDLVNQTAKECKRLGISYTTRVSGDFSNPGYETGKTFCITTYQSLFVKNTAFRNDLEPKGIIFDDAHVAERIIRDAVTMRIDRDNHKEMYLELIAVFRKEFDELAKGGAFNIATAEGSNSGVLLCPPGTAFRNEAVISELLKRHSYSKDKSLLYPYMYLYENMRLCSIYVSSYAIEFTPPFIPTSRFPFLREPIRRVYLSATLEYKTDFIRAFGKEPEVAINPSNDAGNGERLIVLQDKLAKSFDKYNLTEEISKSDKVLISVPSYKAATSWSKISTPPKLEDFSDELESFRASKSGVFCLVSRLDGIDLPHGACRIMIIDGLPVGRSLMEEFLYSTARLDGLFSTKMAVRITQLLGRINRGRSDFGAFITTDRAITNWLNTERNIALLPDLIRKQIILGKTLQENTPELDNAGLVSLIQSVLSRNPDWLKYYEDNINGLELSQSVRDRIAQREKQLQTSALAECDFMSRLWEGDYQAARATLEAVVDGTAVIDPKIAGWYSIWLGLAYEIEGDVESAYRQYRVARSRLTPYLPLPVTRDIGQENNEIETKSQLHQYMLELNSDGVGAINDCIAKLKINVERLNDKSLPSDDHEEALMNIGELFGFGSFRPDDDTSVDGGPDNLWTDDKTRYAFAMELKTKKNDPAEYYKKEIGQSYNHAQWVIDNYPDFTCEGILIIGPNGKVAADASPADNLFHCTVEEFSEKIEQLIARLEDSRGRIALDRWAVFDEMGRSAEWNLPGWFKGCAKRMIRDL